VSRWQRGAAAMIANLNKFRKKRERAEAEQRASEKPEPL
jgi:hypothetical protein